MALTRKVDEDDEPDVSHLTTEDDAPVDNPFQDHQMRLLAHSLYASWPYLERPLVALTDVGVFSDPSEAAIVPDVLLSLDAQEPPGSPLEKRNRSYFIWRYGKPPDVVIEIVSNLEGGELAKLPRYARLGVDYAVVFDPGHLLSKRVLQVHELRGGSYVQIPRLSRASHTFWLAGVSLGLTLWQGSFEHCSTRWLRWCLRDGTLLLTGEERAGLEWHRAEAEKTRADRLAARLREMGLPED